MKSKDYWKKRAESISNYEFEKADNYKLKLEREYKQALKTIQDDIEAFYNKFAENNKISISEAKKTLNSNGLQEFKMDLKEFTRKAKNNKNQQWEKESNNVSYKVRVTRLQALQTQIRNQIENLYTKQQNNTTSLLSDVYEDTYYRNIFEVYKGLGVGVNFAKLDTNTINKVITEPWQGANYSSRIWNNKEILIKELQSNLTQAFIRGDSIDKTSKIIANRMGVAVGRARTLVNTESANIVSKATFDSYSRSGVVKQYQILATLDLHTSKICREMDGKIFDLKDKLIGINAPPFHPNCRTTIVPYFDDAIDEERITRDYEGKVYYVDGSINYDQWYDKHVKGKYDNGLNNHNKDIKVVSNILEHANKGEFTNPKNPKKESIGRFKSGGHGQDNIKLLEKHGIGYTIIKEYPNGVRIGNVPNHKEKSKRDSTGQAWFPKGWTNNTINKSGIYVANLKDKNKYLIEEFKDSKTNDIIAIYKYANYKGVTVGICYDFKKKKVTTIFPDGNQRLLGGE